MADPITTTLSIGWLIAIIAISLWSLVWKGIALWFSGRRKQIVWFIVILIFNTAGIIPIIYLIIYRGKKAR